MAKEFVKKGKEIILLLLLSLTACNTENKVEQPAKMMESETLEIQELGDSSEFDMVDNSKTPIQEDSTFAFYETNMSDSEIYELFLNGELTVEQEEEQLTINELFGDNDIEYCFLDIDEDGHEELHIRDTTAYYAIKVVAGTPQILFQTWWNNYEPVATDELCGFLSYFNRGYGNESINFIKIYADGSEEWDVFRWTDANGNKCIDEEDDFSAYINNTDEEIDMEQYIQYREKYYVKKTEHELVWTTRHLKDYATWQEAYIDFLNKSKASWFYNFPTNEYALIYVDDNDIPELIWYTGVSQGTIVSFYEGKVRILSPSNGVRETKYIEHGGRIYTKDNSSYNVYMLEKGEFSVIGTGWIYEQYFFHGGYRQWYFWEGTEVTEAELEECINELIDTSQCIEPAVLYTKDELLEILADQG